MWVDVARLMCLYQYLKPGQDVFWHWLLESIYLYFPPCKNMIFFSIDIDFIQKHMIKLLIVKYIYCILTLPKYWRSIRHDFGIHPYWRGNLYLYLLLGESGPCHRQLGGDRINSEKIIFSITNVNGLFWGRMRG